MVESAKCAPACIPVGQTLWPTALWLLDGKMASLQGSSWCCFGSPAANACLTADPPRVRPGLVCVCVCAGQGDRPHFAHDMCRDCYIEFCGATGGMADGANPPAFERARRQEEEEGELLALTAGGEGASSHPPGSALCAQAGGALLGGGGVLSSKKNRRAAAAALGLVRRLARRCCLTPAPCWLTPAPCWLTPAPWGLPACRGGGGRGA